MKTLSIGICGFTLSLLFVACAATSSHDESSDESVPNSTDIADGSTFDATSLPPLDASGASKDASADSSDPPVQDADTNPEQDAGAVSIQQLCVDTINQYRATLGLAPLERWTEKESCADDQAKSDQASNTPHGAFNECVNTTEGSAWAQNECDPYYLPLEQGLPACLKAMWDEGPGEPYEVHGHYINMANPRYTKVACGFSISADGKSFWGVQDFIDTNK
ncbi:MAG: CAP domain-containing protein [Polyangiaceae bacterium]|nr:CAP domain-containing protein [Polyangiaceae bacterium]